MLELNDRFQVVRNIQEILAVNLKRLRKQKHMTQSELAEKADLDIRQIQRLEYMESWISPDVTEKLSRALEIEPHVLFIPNDLTLLTKPTKDELVDILKEVMEEKRQEIEYANLKANSELITTKKKSKR